MYNCEISTFNSDLTTGVVLIEIFKQSMYNNTMVCYMGKC